MRFGLGLALLAGFVCALAVAGFPAFATNQSIDAVGHSNWNPANISIDPGDTVTWTNGTTYTHNVCVAAAGASSGCGEWRSGDAASMWPTGLSHQFTTDGTYRYICEAHPNMTGTITVGAGTPTGTGTGTGTGTSTTPPPGSQPTDTITVPTQTQQTTAATDTTSPAFTGKVKRRASRSALLLELGSSEPGTLSATIFRRPPRGRSFSRVSETSVHVKQGRNVVTLLRKSRLRRGAYRVKLQLADPAGNRSAAKAFNFKLA